MGWDVCLFSYPDVQIPNRRRHPARRLLCDEPEGTNLCAEGTDPVDCAEGGVTSTFHCETEGFAQDAAMNGVVLFNGVTLPESTSIDVVLGDPTAFAGQIVRVEGFGTEIGQSQGAYVKLGAPQDSC